MGWGLDDLLAFFGDAGTATDAGAATAADFAPSAADAGAAGGVDPSIAGGLADAFAPQWPDSVGPQHADNFTNGPAAVDTANNAFVPERGSAVAFNPLTESNDENGPLGANRYLASDLGSERVMNQTPLGTDLSREQLDQTAPEPTQTSSVQPPSIPHTGFRAAVGAIPGKWWTAFTDAPGDIANYAGEHPFKTGLFAAGLGANIYGAANQPSAPKPQAPFAFPQPGGGTPASAQPNGGVDVGQASRSPILNATPQVRRSGGMTVGR